MPIDQSKLGIVVQEQMEAIEQDHSEECEIGDVVVIVEVRCAETNDVRVRCSDTRPQVALGLLETATLIQHKLFE
jgi:hypothetical protein